MLYFRRPEHIVTQGSVPPYIILAHEGFDFPPYSPTEPDPIFRMGTYASLSKEQGRTAGDTILRLINDFLAIFTKAEQVQIYNYFVSAKKVMDSIGVEHNAVRKTTDELTLRTTALMSQLHIAERAIGLVERTIPLPSLEYVGKEPHYTKDFSFYETDYHHMTAISLLCKFMCPIWGEFIACVRESNSDATTKRDLMMIDERNNKELFCATMLLPTLETGPLSGIYYKLHGYMGNIIKQVIRMVEANSSTTQPEIDFVMAKYGYDTKRFEDYVYSMLLVKRIVGFDPFQVKDGNLANIATHTNVVISKTAHAKLKHMRNETRTMTRNDVADGGSEPDNVSQTDNMSRISMVTADVPICIVFGVNQQIPHMLARDNISEALYASALAYNLNKLVEPSIFNQALMASLHARWVGGSALLQHLDYTTHVRLLTYTQLYMLKTGWTQLAIYLTCRTKLTKLDRIRPEGQRIGNNIKTTSEFTQLGKRYPGSAEKHIIPYGYQNTRSKKELIETVNILGQIEKIQTWIIDYDHIAEMSPLVLETLPSPWRNTVVPGELLGYDERIMQEVCLFFLTNHNEIGDAA